MSAGTPFVSVIIPVYGAAPMLDDCLDHLARQTYPRDRFEVIVVDNGSPTVDGVVARYRVQLVREALPGSFRARNTGVARARGDVLAFTDDDCLAEPEWLARAVAGLASAYATGIIAGAIHIITPRPAHVAPATYLYSAIFSFRPVDIGPTFGATANLIVRRDIFERVGPFDATLLSGGDWVWGKRALALGIPTVHGADVRVVHEARPSIASVVGREMRLAGSVQVRRERNGPPRKRIGMVYEILDGEIRRRVPWALRVLRTTPIATTPVERAQLGAIVVLVQAMRAFERIRVAFGGIPRRA